MKKYIVKSITANTYYCGFSIEWNDDMEYAERFDEIEEAQLFIQREIRGIYTIETIYVID